MPAVLFLLFSETYILKVGKLVDDQGHLSSSFVSALYIHCGYNLDSSRKRTCMHRTMTYCPVGQFSVKACKAADAHCK
jgi:hypothetical protein